jgi:hypothetical protein
MARVPARFAAPLALALPLLAVSLLGCGRSSATTAKAAEAPRGGAEGATAPTDAAAAGVSKRNAQVAFGPLPNVDALPEADIATSRRARVRRKGASDACAGRVEPSNDPQAAVAALTRACIADGKTAQSFRGTQAGKDAPTRHAFRAAAGNCYRVVAAVAPAIGSVAVVVQDSEGNVAASSSGEALHRVLPADGPLCFEQDDDATIVVGVGLGEGAYALAVVSEPRP